MIILIIFIIFSILLIAKLNSPEHKGKNGEKMVAEWLNILDGSKYIINNIMINDNGKSRQIDHIAITEYGIFVIETKNYAGTIYGKETSNEWRQYLNRKCFNFKNPIHQNYGHLQIVKHCLEGITDEVYSIVVFIRKCKLRIETTTPVVYEDQIVQYIRNQNKVLDKEKIDRVYETLLQSQITNQAAIKNHNENVKRYVQYKEELANSAVCPRCHGNLVKRTGKNGAFYGCSNYPKCRYTKAISQ